MELETWNSKRAALKSSRIRLRATGQSADQVNRTVLVEPVGRFEALRCSSFSWDPELDSKTIQQLLHCVLDWRKELAELSPDDLYELHSLIPRTDPGRGLRQNQGPELFGEHSPLSPEFVEKALSRFFVWVSSDSYSEIHPVKQSILCQLRLLEIMPFSSYSHLVSVIFSHYFLTRTDHLLPTYEEHEMALYEAAIVEAFDFSTDSLVELHLKACLRSYTRILGPPA